ncbi:Beta-amyrin 28-oxidase [Morella rubra]|uniref:Beta-amyrin 28-oxidase n=1 Tax=Morella rubra TaxID=262757 RepID=A0A6A1V4A8_9ROSI|nr:Beta-amyrin 28-oxidase [Morella rubra]
MDAATKQHLERHWNHGEVKVHPLAKNYTLTIACRIFLDVADPDIIAKLEKPMQRISDGFVALPINLPGTIYSRALRASKQLRKDVEQIIKQRRISINLENRESPKQDLLSQMLMDTYTDGQLMEDSDIAYKIFGLIVAAFDNTSTTLVTIINCLAEMPQVYDRVLREQMEIASSKGAGELLSWGDIQKMRYSWHVACEVLRLFPPAPGTFRVAITDFMYEGFRIPKGFKLHWSAFATHKSPQYFSDPEKFDPSRFEGSGPVPFSYVPFGGGPRMCPGKEYARLKVLIFLHNLVTKFRWEKVFVRRRSYMIQF